MIFDNIRWGEFIFVAIFSFCLSVATVHTAAGVPWLRSCDAAVLPALVAVASYIRNPKTLDWLRPAQDNEAQDKDTPPAPPTGG